jgi:hypothetical protein
VSALDVMRRVLTAYETHDLLGMEAHMQELRLAIEQAERQEPEWYHGIDVHGCNRFYRKDEVRPSEFSEPLYTAPPRRQPLTDEEIAEVAERMEAVDPYDDYWKEFVRAIERAHGIGGEHD